jgi:hypothetical protein
MLKEGLHRLTTVEAEQEIESAARQGARIIWLPSNISDKASFVEEIKTSAPLDPPVTTPNWDALEDSLWEGIHSVTEESIVIVWPNAELMNARDPAEFAVATSILESLTRTLSSSTVTLGTPKRLCVILIAG